ncbi:MAG: outer membrane protein assembly factor BamE [Holosporales bacterium]|jgi:outer membrane protein assembly factor BamE (lipoprotein component of BamABCDE complex)|nr:outer membrane protein assembly factor BamE [Holosporales bacterium]
MNSLAKFAILLALLSGCRQTVSTSGNICESDDLNLLKVGVHGINDVYEILGTPSFKLTGNRVLYIGRRLEAVAFLEPKITSEKVVLVTFNQRGVLSDWQIVKLDHKSIVFDKGITPIKGTGRTSADHIFDNLIKAPKRK